MMKRLLSCVLLSGFVLAGLGDATAQSVFLDEDFEGGFPAGWTVQTMATDGGWLWGNSGSLSSAYLPIPSHTNFVAANDDACDCDHSETRLLSSSIDLSAASSVVVEFELMFAEASYGGADESGALEVSTDGGTSFSTVEPITGSGTLDWFSVSYDLTAYAGMSDVILGITYNDGGGWTFGMAVDDVVVREPSAYDMAITDLDLPNSYEPEGNVAIQGTIVNNGGTTINSFDLNYSIDGGATVTTTVSGVTIPPIGSYNFTSTAPWAATASSSQYTIDAWATNLNGNPDANPSDDHHAEGLYIVPSVTPRHVISEHFTSSNCPPCGPANPLYQGVLDTREDIVTNLEYHVWWPYTTDPMYNWYQAGPDNRVSYYNNTAAPYVWIDGADVGGINNPINNPSILDDRAAFGAIFEIAASVDFDNVSNLLTVNVTIGSLADYWGTSVSAHIVVLEEYIPGPNPDPNPNSETEFHNTVRQMLPSPNGTTVTALTQGATQSFTETWTVDAGTVNTDELLIAIFVQDNGPKEVMQGAVLRPGETVGVDEPVVSENIRLYPNPASTAVVAAFDLAEGRELTLDLMDVTGRVIRELDRGFYATGAHTMTIDLRDLAEGVYFLGMGSHEGRQLKPIQVIR